ncbi:MAG TPA: hypothetical protein VHC72_06830, partial [Bryobacteraceae bacterium]|nr:hypothetical protein [Bryobacteraceae bacterium]
MSNRLSAPCKRMDAEFDRRFEAPGAGISSETRAHLETCARCAALYRWLVASPIQNTLAPGAIASEL